MSPVPLPSLLRPASLVQRWRDADPGGLRTMQAGKTLIAVLAMLILLHRADVPTRLLGSMAAAVLLQSTSTGSRGRRMITLAAVAIATITCVTLAASLHGHPLAQHVMLVAVAFAAFFSRRYLPDRGLFLVFVFILTLLATHLPGGRAVAQRDAIALAAAFPVAFALYFFVAPLREGQAFIDATRRFCRHTAELLAAVTAHFQDGVIERDLPARRAIRFDLTSSQALVDALPIRSIDGAKGDLTALRLLPTLLDQYEAAQCLIMLTRSTREITRGIGRGAAVAPWLADAVARLERAFAALAHDADAPALPGECRPPTPPDFSHAITAGARAGAEHYFSAWLCVGELCAIQERFAHRLAQLDGRQPVPADAAPAHEPAAAGATTARADGREGEAPAEPPAQPPNDRPAQISPSRPSPFWFLKDPDTRTALRAAAATLIALLVGDAFSLPRSYWAVLISVVLINGTWGQNVRKSAARVGMTVAGCVVAWALHAATAGHRAAEVAIMLVGVFFAAFFRSGSYAWMTFSVTVYVVFLFALLGESTDRILVIRIYQTFIGCGVALVASLIVPAVRSGRQAERQRAQFWDVCRREVDAAYARLLGEPAPSDPAQSDPGDPEVTRRLWRLVSDLRTHYEASAYEGRFFGRRRAERRVSLNRARLLMHLTLSLRRAARAAADVVGPVPPALREPLDRMRRRAAARPADIAASAIEPIDGPLRDLAAQVESLRQAGALSPRAVAALAPVFAYTRQIFLLAAARRSVGPATELWGGAAVPHHPHYPADAELGH